MSCDKAYLDHITRLENLTVAVCNLRASVFKHGMHHIDSQIYYDEMIAALDRVTHPGDGK